ncbi:MAG: hypothetical protein LQ349_004105 [Xanthoria aureola]|nr:MAG: hypothetical protein LQ349_004105 [Xanthoria aureola]
MVKLNRMMISDDDEFPELSTLIAEEHCSLTVHGLNPTTNLSDEKHEGKKKRPLKIAHVNSILLSLTSRDGLSTDLSEGRSRANVGTSVQGPPKQKFPLSSINTPTDSDDWSSDHMSDFIVDDSDSEDSEEKTSIRRSPRGHSDDCEKVRLSNKSWNAWRCENLGEGQPSNLAATREQHIPAVQSHYHSATSRRDDHFEEPNSTLKFSPPRLKSPSRSPPPSQVVKPPASPTRLKLPSPNKKFRVPPSPHRPSIDAFWSQEVINDWNDSYTPRKPAEPSPSRNSNLFKEAGKECLSPCQTGRRSPSKSPIKKADKEAAERRKSFNKNKFELAASFLQELDQKIVNGQITTLAEPTGGVRLVWSKKLQSTAGRANWRREAIRTKDGEGQSSTTTYRHHASIELAEKVIDDEDRLINVIAHEYCHLLNFMVSNVKDNPHGKEFKLWAKKCSAAFAHRGVHVTTTHVYEISYKYIWVCSKCGVEYKRHSKSIDPARHSCGKCHEKLVQVKPTPRGEGRGMSGYQQFVKHNFARLKRERPEMSMGEVMAALGRDFREAKEKGTGEVVVQVDEVPKIGRDEDVGLDSVMKKLDFLALGTDR